MIRRAIGGTNDYTCMSRNLGMAVTPGERPRQLDSQELPHIADSGACSLQGAFRDPGTLELPILASRPSGKACRSRTAISFSTSSGGRGWSTGKRKDPGDFWYPASSSASSGNTEPLWGRELRWLLKA